jgi:hypothetical protein
MGGSVNFEQLEQLARAEQWSPEARARAFELLCQPPALGPWLLYLDRILLAFGSLCLAAGLGTLISANWALLGSSAKSAALALLILAGYVWAAWPTRGTPSLPPHPLSRRWLATICNILVGPWLSVTFTSGVAPESLFGWWAGLTLGPTVWLRFEPAWAAWWTCCNAGLYGIWDNWSALGAFNLLGWMMALAWRQKQPAAIGIGKPEVPLLFALLQLTGSVWASLVEQQVDLNLLLYLLLLGLAGTHSYQTKQRALLAAFGLSLMLLITTWFAILGGFKLEALLLTAFLVVLQVSLLVAGLKRL